MKEAAKLEITFLGTGTSQGVPMIACDCVVCHSQDPRDSRLRTAAHIRTPAIEFIIDTPPDFRTQALRENIRRIDAVIYTHAHTDHIMGFDDLRRYCEVQNQEMPIYATLSVLKDFYRIFQFAFDGSSRATHNYIRPKAYEITGPFLLGDLEVTPVQLPHGRFNTTGYVFSQSGNPLLAYFTDCNAIPPEAQEIASGVELLVIDALRHRPHPTHMSVEEALIAADSMGAKRTYFTHICHDLGHSVTEAILPSNVRLAFDGLRLQIQ